MDYIITFLIAAGLFAGGWFYGCNVRQWCAAPPQGEVTIHEALAQAESMPAQKARADTAKSAKNAAGAESQTTDSAQVAKAEEDEVAKRAARTTEQTCDPYLTADIRPGGRNDKDQVIKLEKFLNEYEGEKLITGGVYDGTDQAAVKRFQEKYADDILRPAGLTRGNGLVLSGTRKKINELYCAAQKKTKE